MRIDRIQVKGIRVVAIEGIDEDGERVAIQWRLFLLDHAGPRFDSRLSDAKVPQEVREVSEGLMYRDFITVGLLVSKLKSLKTTARCSRTTGSISKSPM